MLWQQCDDCTTTKSFATRTHSGRNVQRVSCSPTMVAFSFWVATTFLVARVAAAPAAVNVPTVPLCHNDGTCYNMPVVGSGSCCGSYNISSWLAQGGVHIGEGCVLGQWWWGVFPTSLSPPARAAGHLRCNAPRFTSSCSIALNVAPMWGGWVAERSVG